MPTDRICSADNCTRPHLARGFCSMHWQRWKATRPADWSPAWGTLEDRIRAKIPFGGPTECWEWKGMRQIQGYGLLKVGQRRLIASRLVYALLVGPIPDGFLICHHCDNPPCVNPAHLFAGTASDNTRDAIRKGRKRLQPDWRTPLTTHCYRGHERTAATTYIHPGGARTCRPCHALGEAARRAKARAQLATIGA